MQCVGTVLSVTARGHLLKVGTIMLKKGKCDFCFLKLEWFVYYAHTVEHPRVSYRQVGTTSWWLCSNVVGVFDHFDIMSSR